MSESETSTVGLDEAAVAAWATSADPLLRAPLRFKRVGHGQSNLTFALSDADGHRRVLRRPPLGRLLASAHDVAREHRILSALGPTDVPTPSVIAFTEDPAVTDVPLLMMEYVDGVVVDGPQVAATLDLDARARLGHELVRTLARIHSVDLQQTGLIDLASHKPFAGRQLSRWRRQWEASKSREIPTIDRLAERLEAATTEQHELTLVHGDFHLLNVIADPGSCEIRAVLDWELCTLGDPLADLGGLLAYWAQPGDEHPGMFAASALPGFPSHAELVATYVAATGRDVTTLGFWHTLALWKIAIIIEGVIRRASDEARNTAIGGAPAVEMVDALVARAERAAADAGI